MEEALKLINLPWITIVTLAGGYAGYVTANTGARDHHKPIEIAFSTLVYGFFSTLGYLLVLTFLDETLLASIAGFVVSISAGVVWRKYGRRAFVWGLRKLRVSDADDNPSALAALFSQTHVFGEQLKVYTKEGTILFCDDLQRFKDAPNGPCVLGSTGDILMYVTARKASGEDWKMLDDVSIDGWGDEITYIPASEVARVAFRRTVSH